MKITKQKLVKIIKEELGAALEGGEKRTIYIVGNFNDAYGAEKAINIKGVYDSEEAAVDAIAEFNEAYVAGPGHAKLKFKIHERELNTPIPVG